MSKKIKQLKPLDSSPTNLLALSFLATLQFSACMAKQSQNFRSDEVDLQPITNGLQIYEQQRAIASKNSQSGLLQDAFVRAIRSGDALRIRALLKEPSIDVNDGGVFISDSHYNMADERWKVNNEQIKQAKHGRKPLSNLSKVEIRLAQPDELKNITTRNIKLDSFDDLSRNTKGVHVSSLVLAAKRNHEAAFLALLDAKNIDLITADPESGFSLLNLVVKNKWTTEAEYLVSQLNQESFLAQCDDNRGTPLHFALVLKLRRSFVERLISRFPKEFLAALDEQKNTPLHLAMKYRSSDIVSALVSKMDVEDLSAQDKDGKNALQLAIERGRAVSIQKLLPKLPADAVAKGLGFAFGCYDNPKLLAQYKQYVDPRLIFKNKTKEIVKLLLTKANHTPDSLDIQQDSQGRTLLHLAIQHGDITAAKLLRNKLPNQALSFTHKDHEGKTPLHLSIASECKDITRFLIDNVPAAQLLSADKAGNTPLSLSLLYKKQDEFDQIVSRIDVNKLIEVCLKKDNNGHSLFASAFLPKANQLSKLVHNRHVLMPSLFLPGYHMFKHMITRIGSALTHQECIDIVNEIDDILSERMISKAYARSLRSLLTPLTKEKAQLSGLTISRYDSYANRKKEVGYLIDDQKDSSSKQASDDGYQSASLASSLGDLSTVSTLDDAAVVGRPMASSPLPAAELLAGESVVVSNPSLVSPDISPIRKAPVALGTPSFATELAERAQAMNNRSNLLPTPSVLAKPGSSGSAPVVAKSVVPPTKVAVVSSVPLPPPPPPMPSFASAGKPISKVTTPTAMNPEPKSPIESKEVDPRSALFNQIKGGIKLKSLGERKLAENNTNDLTDVSFSIAEVLKSKFANAKFANANSDINKKIQERRLGMSHGDEDASSESDSDSEWEE